MERFIAKVVIDEKTGCWVWNGAKGNHGYGVFGVDKGVRLAHRWSLEQKLGRPLKTEEVARHSCDRRECVAPHHLEPGSHSDNMQDMVSRGRHGKGIHADCDHKSGRERADCPKRRRGPTPRNLRGLSMEERFMAYVDISGGDDACWPWLGSTGEYGYGTFNIKVDGKRRTYRATRWIMGYLRGMELEPDEHVLHGCDFPPCTNPRHLRIGTHAENMQEKAERGRHHNANKTHCPQGHEYTPENTYVGSKGGRHCRTCNKGRQQKRKVSRARTTPTKNGSADSVARPTHCKRGHEWTPENTYTYPNGSRYCKACNRESKRQTDKPPVHVLTHCKRGHEYTEANTYITPSTGARKCRQCKKDRRAGKHETA